MKLQLYVSWLMIIRTDFRNLTSANIFLFNFDSPSIDFCKFWLLSNSFSAFSILSSRVKADHFAAMLNHLGSSACSFPRFQSMTKVWQGANLVDYLQSAFSLKIRVVLISSSAIANHDVITTETRRAYGLTLSFLVARFLRFRVQ